MMRFEFATATQIIFGPGSVKELGTTATRLGKYPLLISGCSHEQTRDWLRGIDTSAWIMDAPAICGEPTVQSIVEYVQYARSTKCDMVIGVGGGSALDSAKAIAAMLTNPGDLEDYLEVVGKGQALPMPTAPCITVPTTAGTGSEVTRNAVLSVPEEAVKVSLRSPFLLPRLAIIDPELTFSLPPDVTASTGLDALTQVIEPYVSIKANPMIDAICREGIQRVRQSLRIAYTHGTDVDARSNMSLASLFGGLALANAGLGAVHGFAAPLGGMFHGPHGAICAALLPLVMETNLRALNDRQKNSLALQRYAEIGQILTENPHASAQDGINWVAETCKKLAIPSLSRYGMQIKDIPAVSAKAAQASSMKGNPITLTTDELSEILERAL